MIKHTFSVVDGVGERIERWLWKNGILTWEDFDNVDSIPFFSKERKELIGKNLRYFSKGLEEGDWVIFSKKIKRKEHWRFFEEFKNDAVCIDIETNGQPIDYGGYVTMVGLYDGNEYTCLIRGQNLSEESLAMALAPYKYLITFYGAVFDIPFLQKTYPNLRFNMLHYDIYLESRRIGLRGGFKKFEKRQGISRDDEVDGMDGYDAVRLWSMYQSGDDASLATLIKYNRADTVNLLEVAEYVYHQLKKATGIEVYLKRLEHLRPGI
ncbi:MAG: ribonuclease H-like domain-containing protein [Nitrospirae bacterium]|nr:ribonuclease H-like domain-containing protein [Nitrospirota bacterium]